MPGEKGTWLLERARTVAPATLRLLVTAFSEFKDAVTAINDGGIYHYVHKPWDPTELETLLRRAMEFFLLQRENARLAREKLEALRNVLVADRLVSLGMLTAGLSHHLRNALVSVKSFLDLAPAMMQDEKAAPHELRHEEFWGDYHRRVLQQIDKINDLLKELWATSEQPATQTTERLNLRTVVADCAQTLQETLASRQISIANEIPADLPSVIAERDKFQRLFRLLLKEELASLPPGSVITYTATTLTEGDRSMVRVQIRDNGPGLPAEKLQCLFDPFMVRADTPSEYGIHLMGCFFIVHQHGGRIEAASEPGQGTTFTLSLPTQPAKAVDDINQGIPQKSRLAAQVWGGVRA
jgi:signal transduction histidine kinase